MADHPNAQLVRKGYEAFSKGDMETVDQLFADDIVWHEGGRNPLAGEYKGKDQAFALLGKLFELTEGTLKIDVHDVIANDEHAVALVTISATRKRSQLLGNQRRRVAHPKREGRGVLGQRHRPLRVGRGAQRLTPDRRDRRDGSLLSSGQQVNPPSTTMTWPVR